MKSFLKEDLLPNNLLTSYFDAYKHVENTKRLFWPLLWQEILYITQIYCPQMFKRGVDFFLSYLSLCTYLHKAQWSKEGCEKVGDDKRMLEVSALVGSKLSY